MKYVTTPKPEAQQALIFRETPVNPKACPIMDKMEAGSCAKFHLDEPLPYYNKIKFWKTPIADCGNGKHDCMDYNQWQTAWTQVTG
jgi:putative spermidine/putrescine transport system substrate-binding protein